MKLVLQHLLGVGVLGHHHEPRRPLVQAVYRVEVGLHPGPIVIIQQKITDCIGKVAGSGVDQHPRGLVEDQDVPVLVDDVQGARRRDHPAAPLGVGEPHGEHLPRLHPLAGKDSLPVQQNAVVQPLDPPDHRAREAQRLPQQSVHLLPRPLRRYGEAHPPNLLFHTHGLTSFWTSGPC